MKNFWFNLDDKIRFLFVGGFNFLFSYFLYVVFCKLIGESAYQFALVLAWVLSSFVSFTTQKYLVFATRGNWVREYLKCCTTWFFSYLINAFLLELLVQIMHLNVYLGQFIATFTAAVFTYVLFKTFAFKKN